MIARESVSAVFGCFMIFRFGCSGLYDFPTALLNSDRNAPETSRESSLPRVISERVGQTCPFASMPDRASPPSPRLYQFQFGIALFCRN